MELAQMQPPSTKVRREAAIATQLLDARSAQARSKPRGQSTRCFTACSTSSAEGRGDDRHRGPLRGQLGALPASGGHVSRGAERPRIPAPHEISQVERGHRLSGSTP